MDGVDDEWNRGAFRGEAAENAGLAAVRVNDVGPGLPENFREPAQRHPILPRMNGTNQFGDASENSGRAGEFGFKGTFGTSGRAGNQTNGDTEFLAQTEDGGDGVFLRAADNQPGNNVGDAHWRVSG